MILAFAVGSAARAAADADSTTATTAADLGVTRTSVSLLKDQPPLTFWSAPDKAPKAVLLCLHELGMYSGLFDNLGRRMAHDQNYAVYALDERGFGGWKNFDKADRKMDIHKILRDTKETLEALHTKYPKLPIFLLGESMGGTLALQIAASYPDLVTGTISAAPAGDHYKTKHNYFRVCRNLVTKGPNHRFDMGKELVAAATPRVAVQEAIEKDPEVRLDLTPGELMDCQFFMWKSKDIAKKITSSPVLIVQGQKDGESIPSGAKKVFDKLSTDDKQMLALNDADHYVYEDPHVSDNAFNSTVSWIEAHVKDPKPAK
jgi:alpha-beta hydrolase superfamily lysophospholipase